mmetsp:Transcript_9420/g.28784  ORF Transcript_9420/g.28784 Transcript_9420/m.28784 type:complete len:278 (+) Transcript_9420:565-1398(+)
MAPKAPSKQKMAQSSVELASAGSTTEKMPPLLTDAESTDESSVDEVLSGDKPKADIPSHMELATAGSMSSDKTLKLANDDIKSDDISQEEHEHASLLRDSLIKIQKNLTVMQDVYHKKFQEQSELNKELDTQIQEQAQNFTRLFVALDGRVAENAKKFADKADVKDLTKKSTQFAAQFERLDQHCADVTARLTKIESQTAEFKRFQSEQSAEEDARLDALESRVTELTRVTAETPGAFSDFVHKLKEVKDTSESMQRTTIESLDNIIKRLDTPVLSL